VRVLKFTCFLAALTLSSLVWADVPVVDAYQQPDNSQSSNVQANDDQTNTSTAQASGLDQPAANNADQSSNQNQASNNYNSASNANANLPMDQRVAILEKQAANMTQMLSQMNSLRQQIQDLQGQLDTQTHNVQVLQDQVRNQYKDLDKRLGQSSGSDASTADTSKASKKDSVSKNDASSDSTTTAANSDDTTTASNTDKTSDDTTASNTDKTSDDTTANADDAGSADKTKTAAIAPPSDHVIANSKDQAAYQAAFNLLKDKKYDDATTAFQTFLTKYPNSKSLVNARYWLGQLYLLQGQPDKAIGQFKTILKANAKGTKAPDAMVQLGLAYYAKGDLAQAKAQLTKVQQTFPDSPAANLAKTRLQQIAQSNGSSSSSNGAG